MHFVMQNAYGQFRQNLLLTATPSELIAALYDGAAKSVREASAQLSAGDPLARSRAISKAMDIVAELLASLNLAEGGEFAQRLGSLYVYLLQRLAEAHVQKSETILKEVLGLRETLGGAWHDAARTLGTEQSHAETQIVPVEVQPAERRVPSPLYGSYAPPQGAPLGFA